MSEPRAKQWLADDANFLATLGDLDRGLGGPAGTPDEVPSTNAQDAAVAAHPATAPPPSTAPVTPDARPLLDLFPEWALLPESSAAPATSTSPAFRTPAPAGDSTRRPRPPMLAPRPEPDVASQPARGYQASAEVIDQGMSEAAADLDLQPDADGPGWLARLLIVAVFALLVLAGAVGALWTSRDAVNRTILQWEQMPLPPGGPVRRLSVPIAPIPPPDVIPANLQRVRPSNERRR